MAFSFYLLLKLTGFKLSCWAKRSIWS